MAEILTSHIQPNEQTQPNNHKIVGQIIQRSNSSTGDNELAFNEIEQLFKNKEVNKKSLSLNSKTKYKKLTFEQIQNLLQNKK